MTLATGRASYWLRGIAIGGILATVLAIAVGLAFAAARQEQPFRRLKGVSRRSMDLASHVGIPVAAPLGALLGALAAESLWRRRLTSRCSGPGHAGAL